MLMDASAANPPPCPVCGTPLQAGKETYLLRDIFELWRPQVFPESVVQEHVAISPRTDLLRCPRCRLETFEPKVIGLPSFYEAASRTAPGTAEAYYEDTKWDFSEALRDVQSDRSAVIEFGCGPGNFLAMAAQRTSLVEGVELNPHAVELARDKGLKIHDTLDFPGKDREAYDMAFSFHVLEHVEDPMAFVASMKQQIKPGGLIGISVPNQAGPIRFIQPCAMNLPPHHATRWQLRTFEAAAEHLGLSIRRVAYEPLLLDNHSYYSVYWPKTLLPSNVWPSKLLRTCLSLGLRTLFGGLRRLGMTYFRLLRGQSIYVLMVKQ